MSRSLRHDWAMLRATLDADSYRPGPPAPSVGTRDHAIVVGWRCSLCGGQLAYRPYTRDRSRNAAAYAVTAYRPFAVCLRCDTAEEF